MSAKPDGKVQRPGLLRSRWQSMIGNSSPTIALTDGEDPRAIRAASSLREEGAVVPLLIGRSSEIRRVALAQSVAVPERENVFDPTSPDSTGPLTDQWTDSWGRAGDKRLSSRPDDSLLAGALLLRSGHVDACVGGAGLPTAVVARTAIKTIGLAPDASICSSCFLMVLPEGKAITYADCAIVPEPTAEQLAEIAISSARTHELLTGQVPAVAMLSFSSNGSAKHHGVERVRLGTKLARDSAGTLQIDGELQFDAAFESRIGSVKAPNSVVAGRANVFIFPSLDAGNIAYKITERLGGARAIGPLLLGTARPFNDLSRGCSDVDIHLVALASAVQSLAGPSQSA